MAREKVKTLSAMEAELRSTEYFGKGIKVAAGFDLGTAAPLDSRSIVKTLSARDKFSTDKLAYEGMQVYVEEDQKQYIFKNGEWVEFGFNASDAGDVVKDSIVNDLTTGGIDKALSAEQGKVLKGLIDQEIADRTQADEDLQLNIDTTNEALTAHILAYEEKVKELEAEDLKLQSEINDVKDLLGNKNSNTQIFETSQEFQIWAEDAEPKLGDLVFIIEHKRSYIYKGVAALVILEEEPFVVPNGWVLFDEISTEVDLVAYAKKAEVEQANQALEAKITVNAEAIAKEVTDREQAIEAEKLRATGAEEALQQAITAEEQARTAADAQTLEDAKAYVDEEIKKLNTGDLVDRVTVLEDEMDTVQEDLTNVESRVTQLETDLVENAQAIVAIEARRFILTRSQEIVTIQEGQLTYPITVPNNGNAVIDVIKNSVVLVNGVDYTYTSTEITFNKQYAAGAQIHILKTYNEVSPELIPAIDAVKENATEK